ncbi:type II secretion system protein GspK [Bradyrhizobium sp. GCM10023182]|uniref:Helix-hairpin-helix domain-containing protein n=1 Tax=Bradyrhizobium zhengyangense TaxID=2911009 RepID=A0ABS9M0M1_9BRAD|nr:type II secretion system protein GspK [Bradyrhizobium zhengyangense]MCG2672808.1 helix-hairpin-helix domain-containing protein [Bradyrhizobium zhengyangense]
MRLTDHHTLPTRFRPIVPVHGRACPARRGFALVTVIWGLGLLTLLGTVVIVGARYRAKTAVADGMVASTAAAAESAVNLAISVILDPLPGTSFPRRCRLPEGERIDIAVEEEIGKIDLNAANLPTLERFFVGLTRDKALGSRIAQNIVDFRKPPQPSNAAGQTRNSGFSTIMELDRIDGISPSIFRAAVRFTTVLSGRVEPAPEAATADLRILMNLDPSRPARRRPALPGNVTIRADVSAPDGSRYIREALVTFGAASGQPYAIREWRRGDVVGEPATRSDGEALQSCFRL